MTLKHLKVGDRVTRFVGQGVVMMQMEVIQVNETTMECAHIVDEHLVKLGWNFDRESGAEEDDSLGWGVKYGHTGTYIKENKP